MAPPTPPQRAPILLVEDKDSLRQMLRLAIEGQGHTVIEARDQPDAVRTMQQSRPSLVLTDLRLPEGDGFGVLRAAKELDPQLPVIVMTAYGSIQDAVAAMKEGALDFLAKPVDPDHLLLMVERALAQRRLLTEYILLKEELATRRGAPLIIGEAPSLKNVISALQRAAGTDATVLLEGESGTGKELFARALHALSERSDGPFVAINCAAIPDNLLETELFGHEKGAFTGAVARKPGKFELAHRGTLFLDEIGDLPIGLQAKILRALEERRFERVGGTSSLQVDVRIVAATNKGLRMAVAAKQFREDLYFRLSVFPITIPPLRERKDDIPILARHFVERFCRDLNKKVATLAPGAIEELQRYGWPGNVRELQNCMERSVILADTDTIHARHLNLALHAPLQPVEAPNPWTSFDFSGSLADVGRRAQLEAERRKITQTLQETAGNKMRAAETLGVSYKAFLMKMRECGIE
ncbi:MAG: sigma-54 dependent transcriptional regulator [Vicinamibacterales bacterium]|nr:sigma-54 dependent transcriptional regulator [Vicinamibacterales bacterium]